MVAEPQVAAEPQDARHAADRPAWRAAAQPGGPSAARGSAREGDNAHVSDLIDTTEMYLRTIFELEEEGVTPLRARIAERLGQSGPTVSQTVARMERDGLLTVEGDRHLELTDQGRAMATRVMRKHRLAECLLVDVIGLEWEDVHAEACRWEHVMSEAVERRLLELLDQPTVSPYGNPIPGLDELGIAPDERAADRTAHLVGRRRDRRAAAPRRPPDRGAAAGRPRGHGRACAAPACGPARWSRRRCRPGACWSARGMEYAELSLDRAALVFVEARGPAEGR